MTIGNFFRLKPNITTASTFSFLESNRTFLVVRTRSALLKICIIELSRVANFYLFQRLISKLINTSPDKAPILKLCIYWAVSSRYLYSIEFVVEDNYFTIFKLRKFIEVDVIVRIIETPFRDRYNQMTEVRLR